MYIYLCVFVVLMHVCMKISMYIYRCVFLCIYVYVCENIYVYIPVCFCIYLCIYTRVFLFARYVHAYVRTYEFLFAYARACV